VRLRATLALLAVLSLAALVGCGGGDDEAEAPKPSKPPVALSTKQSFVKCLADSGVAVDKSTARIGKLEFQGIAVEYVGTVELGGGSFVASWVGTGENQTDPAQRVKDIAEINSTGPELNPDPATLDYYWDSSRNVLFAIPVNPPPSASKQYDQCLQNG
jgi:hypothetical protein